MYLKRISVLMSIFKTMKNSDPSGKFCTLVQIGFEPGNLRFATFVFRTTDFTPSPILSTHAHLAIFYTNKINVLGHYVSF